MHLAEALLHLLNRGQVLRLSTQVAHVALALWQVVSLQEAFIEFWLNHSLELLQWHCDAVLFDNSVQLVDQTRLQLIDRWTLFLGVAAIVDPDLLVGVVELPRLTLVLVVEVDDEERVFKVNEEVAHVGHLLWLLFVFNNVERGIPALVVAIDLVFQLLFRVAAWDVLDAEVSSQLKTLLHEVNLDRLAVSSLIVRHL